MISKFLNLKEEKRRNIINAAVEEFGAKGFDNASTDIIAEKSGIAKGSLFHYFGSKKNLYLFIVEHCVDILTTEVLDVSRDIESQDFYERIKEISIIKQKMVLRYQLHSKIILDAFMNMPHKLRNDLERLYIKYYTSNMKFIQENLFGYLNVDLLKPTITKEDALFVTMTLFEALSKKYTELYKSRTDDLINKNDVILKEFDRYVDIIKYGLYK